MASRDMIDVASVTDQVAAVLRQRVLTGAIEPGARLHQADLARDLGVSRTPVREALGRLAADGLIELLPNRGARVRDVRHDEMWEAYEARLAVEPPAAALAAERRPPAELAAMDRAVRAHRAARGDVETSFAANRAFHLALVAASGNRFLLRFAESLWVSGLGLRIYERQRETPALIAADADAHAEIMASVGDGDAERAVELLRTHIIAARELLLEGLSAAA